jgi:hypothetical protein
VTLARVEKRDGREVPFDESKIAAAIEKAMAAVGEPDDGFAGEVASVVRLTLEERHGIGSLPHIEEIQDLVEQALIELGRARVAKAYILYRDQRARARAALDEGLGKGPKGHRGLARVQVRESDGTSPWSKGRIVAALMREADLARDVSEKVAARVETRVFQAGLPQVTTALVRELVEAELFALGLEGARRRQTSFGLPLFDLRALLEAPPAEFDPRAPVPAELLCAAAGTEGSARVGSEVLRRFAEEELLGAELGQAQRGGDLFVHELGLPHQPLWVAIPSGALAARSGPEGAFELLGELAALARGVAHGVVLEDPLAVLAPISGGKSLGAWLRAAAATARGLSRRLDLSSPGLRAPALLERLAGELGEQPDDAFAPRLLVDERELAFLADRGLAELDRLLLTGRVVATWTSGGERLVAPGCHRAAGERAASTCGAAVSINLPRLALRAGPWREDRLLELLSEAVEAAVHAARSLITARRGQRPWAGRISAAVAPVGLREALQVLSDGAIDAELGARLLGFLADALGRAERAHRLRTVLSPCFGARAAARFAALDTRLPHRNQRLLFAPDASEDGGGADDVSAPYSTGFRISGPSRSLADLGDGWPLEARLTATVAVGALDPLPLAAGPSGGPGSSAPPPELPQGSVARAALACLAARALPGEITLVPQSRARRAEPALFSESAPQSP